jgi:hypothetical protein
VLKFRYLLDQLVSLSVIIGRSQTLMLQPPPDRDEDKMVTKLRETLKRSLEEVRKNAE